MTDLRDRDRAFWLTVLLATGAGAIAAVAIEVTLTIRRLAGHIPSNTGNQPMLVIGVFLLCGVAVGVKLAASAPQRGQAGPTAAASLTGALVGVAVGVIAWTVVEGLMTGRENGMELLNIPFLWVRGLAPLLLGTALGALGYRLARGSRSKSAARD